MLNRLLILSYLVVIFFTSCQKDLKTQPAIVNSGAIEVNDLTAPASAAGVVDNTNKWYGTYTGYANPYPVVSDEYLIKDGSAKLPYLDRQFYYSNILYDIPASHYISGDSVSFEANVKNPKASGFSDYDIIITLVGEQHSAEVHFVADDDYAEYTEYSVGDAQRKKLDELVHLFGFYQTIKLAQKNYYTAVYINNNLVYKFKYGIGNSIGKIKTISIAFKGYGSCNRTGLKNSFTGKPILSEEFNINGQTNTVYY